MNNKIFLFKFIIFALIFSIFFLAEYCSYLFLKNHYQKINNDHELINIKKFSLFSKKDEFGEHETISAFYNYRYKENYILRNGPKETLIKSQYKGMVFSPPLKNEKNIYNSKDYYNIYFFGGSTSFNKIGIPLSHFLYGGLKNTRCNVYQQKKVRVIHAGHSGYSTPNQVNRLVTDIIILKPDLVIFFDGINDFIASHGVLNWDFNDTGQQERLKKLLKNKNNFINFNELSSLPNRFYSLYLIGRASKTIFKKNIFPTTGERAVYNNLQYSIKVIESLRNQDGYNHLGAINYINNHKILSALTNFFSFQSMHIFQPTLSNGVKKRKDGAQLMTSLFPDPEKILTNKEKKIVAENWFDKSILFYKDVKKDFTSLSDKNNYYYDYSDIFSNEKNMHKIYYDSIHYTDYAVEIINKKIIDDFKSFCNK